MEIIYLLSLFCLYAGTYFLGKEHERVLSYFSYLLCLLVTVVSVFFIKDLFFFSSFIHTEHIVSRYSLFILTIGIVVKRFASKQPVLLLDLSQLIMFDLVSRYSDFSLISYVVVLVFFASKFFKRANISSVEAFIAFIILMFFSSDLIEYKNGVVALGALVIIWVVLFSIRIIFEAIYRRDHYATDLLVSFVLSFLILKISVNCNEMLLILQIVSLVLSFCLLIITLCRDSRFSIGLLFLLTIPFGISWEFYGLLALLVQLSAVPWARCKFKNYVKVPILFLWLWIFFGQGNVNVSSYISLIHLLLVLLSVPAAFVREVAHD